ncbi:Hypothetical protein ORPV_49 [Orpheovirus IHUMI-LCC2]|uniref:Uncharacterized protein n=1 Tax=Orpheovirus IHUMI-LCC2 TaxID=2023057 RepID=A0A2I2L351_9VIRU|nr:Hypothetical protein ORPV_49 [Orpheovirus IHUMI-LCC2]SNW61953.1 Hypothetical protein ORPV_49 [Orpheovirus IHUMI-LCC2]
MSTSKSFQGSNLVDYCNRSNVCDEDLYRKRCESDYGINDKFPDQSWKQIYNSLSLVTDELNTIVLSLQLSIMNKSYPTIITTSIIPLNESIRDNMFNILTKYHYLMYQYAYLRNKLENGIQLSNDELNIYNARLRDIANLLNDNFTSLRYGSPYLNDYYTLLDNWIYNVFK